MSAVLSVVVAGWFVGAKVVMALARSGTAAHQRRVEVCKRAGPVRGEKAKSPETQIDITYCTPREWRQTTTRLHSAVQKMVAYGGGKLSGFSGLLRGGGSLGSKANACWRTVEIRAMNALAETTR